SGRKAEVGGAERADVGEHLGGRNGAVQPLRSLVAEVVLQAGVVHKRRAGNIRTREQVKPVYPALVQQFLYKVQVGLCVFGQCVNTGGVGFAQVNGLGEIVSDFR